MKSETRKFLIEDFQALEARIESYEERLRIARGGIHEATTQSSETWHDNPAFDDAQQQSKMWDNERRKLVGIRAESEIVSAGQGPQVTIGTTVRFRDLDAGSMDEITVGSYMTPPDDEDVISYAAPLAQLLLGNQPEDVVEGVVGKVRKRIQIVSVAPAAAYRRVDPPGPATIASASDVPAEGSEQEDHGTTDSRTTSPI